MFLSLVLVPTLKREPFAPQRGALIRAAGQRFRVVVWSAVGVLLTTGLALAAARGWSFAAPRSWPPVLIVKLVLVALLLVLTVVHDVGLGPRVGRILQTSEASRTDRDRLLVAGSAWVPRVSLLIALAVLLAAVRVARS